MHQIGTTLTQFILEEQRKYSGATGEFSCVLNDIALACKKIAALTSKGDLIGVLGSAGSENVHLASVISAARAGFCMPALPQGV